jgi:hypothetical protein
MYIDSLQGTKNQQWEKKFFWRHRVQGVTSLKPTFLSLPITASPFILTDYHRALFPFFTALLST